MIDWLTLRLPLNRAMGDAFMNRIMSHAGVVTLIDAAGKEVWSRLHFDFEKLRSDTPGLFWTVQVVKQGEMPRLVIGGSPATLEHDCNVFGSDDVQHCASVLIRAASRVLEAFLPKNVTEWECRRIDITENYDMGGFDGCKQALRDLLRTDRARRYKATSVAGSDTVAWNPTSTRKAGKAYHKGPQLASLQAKGKIDIDDERLALSNRLLRFELKLGSQFFRDLQASGKHWFEMSSDQLNSIHEEFFGGFFGSESVKVADMSDYYTLLCAVASSNQGDCT